MEPTNGENNSVFDADIDNKPSNRFQVQRVGKNSTPESDGPPEYSEFSKAAEGTSEDLVDNEDGKPAAPKDQLEVKPQGKVRHVSMKSNGDTTTSLDHDTDHDTYRKFDTHNLKTFGKNTHEAIPHLDFYRQTGENPQYKRPTLDQLHEEPVSAIQIFSAQFCSIVLRSCKILLTMIRCDCNLYVASLLTFIVYYY